MSQSGPDEIMIEFHNILHEYYDIRDKSNLILINQSPRINNKNIADAWICEVGMYGAEIIVNRCY
jgi:hypothetical protein